jgi:hypothetical protein
MWSRSTRRVPAGRHQHASHWEAYGLGIAILGAVAGLVRYDPNLVGFVLASWLLGGIVLLGITDGLLSWWSRRT